MQPTSDLVCLSHLRWGFVFQRPNHLMGRCAKERRTFFWEEPIFDDGLRSEEAYLEIRQELPNLFVVVPRLPGGLSEEEITREQRRLIDQLHDAHDIRKPLLWFYTPMALDFAGHIEASATVYDCMDELSAFDGAPPALVEREQELFARADVVFTGGQSLYEEKRTQHPRVHAFPSSVDRDHFARARREGIEDPSDQRALGRPRLGYFGVIDERIDLQLLAAIADADAAWQIVMIGPVVKIDPASLPRRPNITYLGQKSYAELPNYVAGWDAALMPFALNASTRFISPTKTLEYLAAGKPVVSTAVRDVVTPYGERGLVRIADRETFPREIAACLAEAPEARRDAADAFVAQTSWDRTWRRMWSEIAAPHARRTPQIEAERYLDAAK